MRLVLLALLLIPSICFGGWSVKHVQVVEEDVVDPNLISHIVGTEDNGDPLLVGTGTVTVTGTGRCNDHDGNVDSAFNYGDAAITVVGYPVAGNFDGAKGKITGWYKHTGAVEALSTLFGVLDGGTRLFELSRNSSDTSLRFGYNGTLMNAITVVTNLWDGNWHEVEFTWDHDGTNINTSFTIDSDTPVLMSATLAEYEEGGDFRIGQRYFLSRWEGCVENVKIYSE